MKCIQPCHCLAFIVHLSFLLDHPASIHPSHPAHLKSTACSRFFHRTAPTQRFGPSSPRPTSTLSTSQWKVSACWICLSQPSLCAGVLAVLVSSAWIDWLRRGPLGCMRWSSYSKWAIRCKSTWLTYSLVSLSQTKSLPSLSTMARMLSIITISRFYALPARSLLNADVPPLHAHFSFDLIMCTVECARPVSSCL